MNFYHFCYEFMSSRFLTSLNRLIFSISHVQNVNKFSEAAKPSRTFDFLENKKFRGSATFSFTMSKRGAISDLNHDNWDEEDEAEEAGTFAQADQNTLKDRVIKKAKRRGIAKTVSYVILTS